MGSSSPLRRRLLDAALILAIAAVAWFARDVHDMSVSFRGGGQAFSMEPDSQYHMRRVAGTLHAGLPPEEFDEALNTPHGSAIPWPPYYTYLLHGLLTPGAPDGGEDPTRPGRALRLHVERGVLAIPTWLGVLTALLAAALGGALAGRAGALLAGLLHALSLAAILYARPGNGDHHAWVSLLAGGLLLVTCLVLQRGVLQHPAAAWRWGALLGALAGLALGSWVGSLLHILQLQLVLAVLLFVNARRTLPGLAPLGLAFHLTALAVVTPAVLSSPWKFAAPWMVVNLSWFHLAHLALGALVFVPLLKPGISKRARRRHAWLVGAALAGLGIVLALLPFGPGPGIADGFAWVRRAETFMAGIAESRPLLGPDVQDPSEILRFLGYGVLILPLAWLAGLARLWRQADHPILPLVIAAPPLVLQAAGQARFAEALVLPMAALLAWALAGGLARCGARGPLSALLLAAPFAVGLSLPGSESILERAGNRDKSPATLRQDRALRRTLEWLGESEPVGGVLADWSFGHAIEWVAGRSTVATNFGSYVGEDSFRDPARFFLCEEPDEAERLLERRGVTHVLITTEHIERLPALIAAADPEREPRYIERAGADQLRLRSPWYRTMGAALYFGGTSPKDPRGGLGFLRCAHASRIGNPTPPLQALGERPPSVLIFERVPGASLVAQASAGQELVVRGRVHFPDADWTLPFVARGSSNGAGLASVRVPYSSNGGGEEWHLEGPLEWELPNQSGSVTVDEDDVQGGRTIEIR